jgi:hypothetical protein
MTPVTAGAAPWYTSQVQIAQVAAFASTLVALSPGVWAKVGITSTADVQSTVQAVAGALAALALLWGLAMRAWSAIQPLVWSKKAAAAHPATVAVEETQAAMKAANIPTAAATQAKIVATKELPK